MTSAVHTQQQFTFDEARYRQQPAAADPMTADRMNVAPPIQPVDPRHRVDPAVPVPVPAGQRPRIDQGRFWVGAALTAMVAGLAAVIGLVIAQDLLRVQVSLSSIGLPGAHIGSYGAVAGGITLLAAAAFNAMAAVAPRPTVYYTTLAGLLTALAVLMPFTASVSLTAQLAWAVINLAIGVLIIALVPLAATATTR